MAMRRWVPVVLAFLMLTIIPLPAASGTESIDPWPSAPFQSADDPFPLTTGVFDGPIVIETIDPSVTIDSETVRRIEAIDASLDEAWAERRSGAPAGTATAVTDFVPLFDPNVPASVRATVGAAIAQWGAELDPTVPVVVQVSWLCLGDLGILGFAGATGIYQMPELPTRHGYPVALANTLLGRDLNGAIPEVRIVLNAELGAEGGCRFATNSWHVGTAQPPPGKIDMTTVVLHEVAHGLGFLGSPWRPPGTTTAQLGQPRYAYDALVHTVDGPLLERANPDASLTSALSIDVGGGLLYGLYSPAAFIDGSSFSHFNAEATSGNRGGALMRPELGAGVVHRSIDAAVLGVLGNQGWPIARAPVTPTISVRSGSRQVSISIDPWLAQSGGAPSSYRVEARRQNVVDAVVTVSANRGDLTLAPLYDGVVYDLTVTPLDRARAGTPAAARLTMPDRPNQPQRVQSSGDGRVQRVSWAAPVAATGAEIYRIEMRPIGGGWSSLGETTDLQFVTPALQPGVHQFRVVATRSGAVGPAGTTLLIGVADGIVRPFPLDGQVGRLFSAYFLRQPDRAGYAYWMRQRAAGVSPTTMSSAFADSAEFRARYGALGDRAFVELVYRNVLGRAADGPGLDYWTAQLNSGRSRGEVMLGFSESPEYITSTATTRPTSSIEGQIARLYFAFFLREPDPAGQAFWVGLVNSGVRLDTIAQEMAASPEFTTSYGSLPDERFVELVYNNVLTRVPDAAGFDHWLSALRSGVSRGTMMTGFSESLEFVMRTGTMP